MTKIQTTEMWLEDIIRGKQPPMRCSGYSVGVKHKPVDYQLIIGKGFYSYSCPICGFGQGGSMQEETCKRLRQLQNELGAKSHKETE